MNDIPYGHRLLPSLVDCLAITQPETTFITILNGTAVEDGFRNVSYREFAQAVNHCCWKIENELEKRPRQPTEVPVIGYMGAQDATYLILILACNKTGYTVSLLVKNPVVYRNIVRKY